MKQLAVEFGVTPQAISKLCAEFDIPKPGYGYWTLRDMGRPVDKPSLSVEARPAEQAIAIEAKAPRTSKPPPVAKPKKTEIASSSPAEPKLETAIPKPEPSHAVIQRTSLDPAPFGSTRRKEQLLAQLIQALEARGWSGTLLKPPYKITVDGEPLTLELTEQTDRIVHVKTDKENAALQKFEADRLKAQRAGRWFSDWDRPKIPEWDNVPNGKLTLKFEAGWHHHGLRRSFADGKRQRLEELIDAIMTAFAAYAQGEKDHRAELERRRLEAIEEEKRRRERQRRLALENKRLEFLGLQMDRFDEAVRIEAFVADYPQAGRKDEKVSALLDWALGRAARLRAEFAPERLCQKLDGNDLMNDAASEAIAWRPVE